MVGARQWIPAEQISDPIKTITTGLPLEPTFATKGELAVDLLRDAFCDGTCLTCEQAVAKHLQQKSKWTIRSAGDGSKGERTYAWAWIATASPTHYLLVRKRRTTGELAFHYCYVPTGQPVTLPRLIAAAGLRWPVEESSEFSKDLFGLDQAQVRLYERSCATPYSSWPPWPSARQAIAEIKRLFNTTATNTLSLEHVAHWSAWRRRHQARARWFHRRARLATAYTQLSQRMAAAVPEISIDRAAVAVHDELGRLEASVAAWHETGV
ncbi:hypothetical protein ACIBHX_31865 [Nonomuraea sp. NPDC050536]|uniref:hypothetical protein n=1 Tax=Nonomuraea sp. NPDC050536 TaxID=3364366 RepID=UPI0037CA86B9